MRWTDVDGDDGWRGHDVVFETGQIGEVVEEGLAHPRTRPVGLPACDRALGGHQAVVGV